MTEYTVIYEQAGDGGWGAFVLELPGVVSAGDTPAEAESGIREAIALYCENHDEQGEPVPAVQVHVGRVTV